MNPQYTLSQYTLSQSDITSSVHGIGGKSKNLKILDDLGLNVPPFIVLPSRSCKVFFKDTTSRHAIIKDILSNLGGEKFAVRSSALIEDGGDKSFAGQFSTKIDVDKHGLETALLEVIQQANKYLDGDLDKFSVIVQHYIVANISGVAFTRNPHGSREMVIEYGKGIGEKIVSGSSRPNIIQLYRTQTPGSDLPQWIRESEFLNTLKSIEKHFSSPQDIERCYANGKVYFLQTRPITTISPKIYQQNLFLDEFASNHDNDFFYEKTELHEILPRPVPINFSLLQSIYATGGPVDEVYKTLGIDYQSTNFLKIIGNELFVNKEQEIIGILPGYSTVDNAFYKPKFKHFSKLISTVKNLIRLNAISLTGYDELFSRLQSIFSNNTIPDELNEWKNLFLEDYRLIFEINLKSGLSLKRLDSLLQREDSTPSEIIDAQNLFLTQDTYSLTSPQSLLGNSLDITDTSGFKTNSQSNRPISSKIQKRWDEYPKRKKPYLQKVISQTIIWNRLREYGRRLTIRHISSLRIILSTTAKHHTLSIDDLYFSTFEDIHAGIFDREQIRINQQIYNDYSRYSLPSSITAKFIQHSKKTQGVSAGKASGLLVDSAYLDTKFKNGEKYILYTQSLYPHLTQYFDKIVGIVSDNGGLLSHLSIMARENNLPIVIGIDGESSKNSFGKIVTIDGGVGSMVVDGGEVR